MSLMMSNDKGISAFPKGDNLLSWIATVTGPDDSVYEGTVSVKFARSFKITIAFLRS